MVCGGGASAVDPASRAIARWSPRRRAGSSPEPTRRRALPDRSGGWCSRAGRWCSSGPGRASRPQCRSPGSPETGHAPTPYASTVPAGPPCVCRPAPIATASRAGPAGWWRSKTIRTSCCRGASPCTTGTPRSARPPVGRSRGTGSGSSGAVCSPSRANGSRAGASGCADGVLGFSMANGRLTDRKDGLWARIKRIALTDVGALMRGLNADDLEKLEQVLIEADFGVAATVELTQALEDEVRKGKLKTEGDLRRALEGRLSAMLNGDHQAGALARNPDGPTVILVVGVNGTGKTTTVAKLARRLQREGRRVVLAAADTYRAGAIAQLQVWAERLGIPCIAGVAGGDPAAVAFDAVDAAVSRGLDTVIVDTAGRLHTQEGLMDELRKVVRVIARRLPGAPHETLLVLDGTVGQNAIQQGRLFGEAVKPTGIIVTKLDGSARGGAVTALRRELGLPIRFLGVGEQLDDLQPFDPERFAQHLLAESA